MTENFFPLVFKKNSGDPVARSALNFYTYAGKKIHDPKYILNYDDPLALCYYGFSLLKIVEFVELGTANDSKIYFDCINRAKKIFQTVNERSDSNRALITWGHGLSFLLQMRRASSSSSSEKATIMRMCLDKAKEDMMLARKQLEDDKKKRNKHLIG
eukprot:TRINITY_DN11106_c0_g3_i1.p1 TRINITY_DN11106_c0_g3~~TRINITY_DN11106_c0_g3_i1.p1  ORF type:complete len:183 (-),score=31.16 TRINITY_DN11106_c0_g3_i1:103-573(-)